MARTRSRLWSVSFLLFAAILVLWLGGSPVGTAFTSAGDADGEETKRSLLSYFPLYNLINAGHTGYPIPMMFGFICRGNVELRKACDGNPYPNWIMGFLLGIICYTYPGNVMSDTMFTPGVLRGLSNNNIFMVYTFWYVVIQNSEAVYKFLLTKHVNILITVWFLMDATHASLCFLERSVSPPGPAVFSRGVFQCFVWCSAAATLQCAEKAIRGAPIPKLSAAIPNTMDVLGNPVICMFWGMFFYMLYMMYCTDCNVFQKDGKTLFQCGVEHPDVYVMFHYVPMILHLVRAYRPQPAKK
mmetsp:Transcript_36364/g.77427  ORF Transcript_36364/g.77427 Transcript_36364/m.77427 type:complete len:299 (+) Transcript_36364:99-995(+)